MNKKVEISRDEQREMEINKALQGIDLNGFYRVFKQEYTEPYRKEIVERPKFNKDKFNKYELVDAYSLIKEKQLTYQELWLLLSTFKIKYL